MCETYNVRNSNFSFTERHINYEVYRKIKKIILTTSQEVDTLTLSAFLREIPSVKVLPLAISFSLKLL